MMKEEPTPVEEDFLPVGEEPSPVGEVQNPVKGITIAVNLGSTKKIIMNIFAIIGFLTVLVIIIGVLLYPPINNEPVAIPVTPAPTPVPVVTVTQVVPTYPQVITFTVLAMTTGTGHYQIMTDMGDILYLQYYKEWSEMTPRAGYTANIVGQDPDTGAYYISNVYMMRQAPPEFEYTTNSRQAYTDYVETYHQKTPLLYL